MLDVWLLFFHNGRARTCSLFPCPTLYYKTCGQGYVIRSQIFKALEYTFSQEGFNVVRIFINTRAFFLNLRLVAKASPIYIFLFYLFLHKIAKAIKEFVMSWHQLLRGTLSVKYIFSIISLVSLEYWWNVSV